MSGALADWQQIDRQPEPGRYVEYMDRGERTVQHQQIRDALLRAAGPRPGAAVDVGCGLGLAVEQLAAHGWHATGLDANRTMVEEARRRRPGHDFRIADALALPFADGVLDLYRAERLWIHLTPRQSALALAEARRVLRPGGRIAIAEADFETFVFTCGDDCLATARAARAALGASLRERRAGSLLRGRLVSAGFEEVVVDGHVELFTETRLALPMAIDVALAAGVAAGRVTVEEATALREDLERLERDGAFQMSLTMFVVSARKR
jgi:SAM-dependent methyltransferase